MYLELWILFLVFLLIGIVFNFFLFLQDKAEKRSKKFLASERFLFFLVEIIIAVTGFGVTLAITNANEERVEKEKTIQMIQQTIEYTDREISREKAYLVMHNNEEIDTPTLLVSNVLNMDYYNNILSHEAILQHVNMNTYGDIMTYLVWIENSSERAEEAEKDASVYTYMYRRYSYLMKLRDLLAVCRDELNGKLTAEQAQEKCKEIKDMELSGYKSQTS